MQATARWLFCRAHDAFSSPSPDPGTFGQEPSPSFMSTSTTSHEMTPLPEPISATRLAIALGLVSFAAFALWSSEGAAAGMLGLPIFAANLVMMSRSERARPVSRNQLIGILVVLAVLVLCIVLFPGERTAATRQRHVEQLRWYSQAYFVLPVWALICYSLFSRYRRSRQSSDSTSTVTTSS